MRKWLIDTRKSAKLTQEEIANLSNITRPAYTRIENGTRRPSPEIAKRIGKVLGFDWTKFYENE